MFAFIDTETTGFARQGIQPRIVSIAWMLADNPSQPRVFKNSIVRPDGYLIPSGAASVHGITTERALLEGKPLNSVLVDFANDLLTLKPKFLIAHNAAFDLPIIAAEFDRLGRQDPCRRIAVQCTMVAARQAWPGQSAKLGDVYQRLFGAPMQNAHNAGADVWACAQVYFRLAAGAMRRA
jgi:DNA polymerase III epsilon subunit-like protein